MKSKNIEPLPDDCTGQGCDWASIGRMIQCVDGAGGCSQPPLCEGEKSSFHDEPLIEATKKINRILKRIPKDAKGRRLSFCDTGSGMFLAWIETGSVKGKGVPVTRKDGEKAVAKALKLVKDKKK